MTEVKYPSGKKQITIQDDGSIYLYKDNDIEYTNQRNFYTF